jgi:hypothetical protein
MVCTGKPRLVSWPIMVLGGILGYDEGECYGIAVGRHLWGHVSRTGPRPTSVKALYDMNAPFVETLEQATHFKRGPEVYGGAIYPWKEPITGPYRDRVEQGLPPFEVDGDWPWNADFFPKPS